MPPDVRLQHRYPAADGLVFLSKDTVHRRLCQLVRTAVLVPLDRRSGSTFALAVKVVDLADAWARKPAAPPVARTRSTGRSTRRSRRPSDAAQAGLPLAH
jgi:hypothetical protein